MENQSSEKGLQPKGVLTGPETTASLVPSEALSNEKTETSRTPSESPDDSDNSVHLKAVDTHHTNGQTDEEVRKTVTQQRRDAEASIEYPTGLKMLTIVFALCLAVLCVALDNTIIATAIPHITVSLNDSRTSKKVEF